MQDASPTTIAHELRKRVFKVGGASLFSGPDWIRSFGAMVQNLQGPRFVVVGGGATIDSMRELHAMYPSLDEEAMHWRCIRLLDATWEVMCELFPDWVPIATWDQLNACATTGSNTVAIVRPGSFYSPTEVHHFLPHCHPRLDWRTTSDALAWLLAIAVEADELCIVKRCKIRETMTVEEASREHLVDSELARLAGLNATPSLPTIRFFELHPME